MPDLELPASTTPIAATTSLWRRKSRAKPKSEHKKRGAPVRKPRLDLSAPKPKIGRPPVLTDERKKTIVALILTGNYMTTAADYVGVSMTAIEEALKRGRAAHSGPDSDFAWAVGKAHASWTADLVASTTNAALRNPEIALKMLSRRAKGWSNRPEVDVQHTGAIGSFDVAPRMGEAVRMDSASNVAFHEFLARLSDAGAFDPGGPLSVAGPRESGAPCDAGKPRA